MIIFAGIVGATDVPKVSPIALGEGWGSPNLVLIPKNGKTSVKHPTHANNSILIFCGAKRARGDPNYMKFDKVVWRKYSSPDSTNVGEASEVNEFGKSVVRRCCFE